MVIIVNKDRTSIVNFEQIENIFIGDSAIKANLKSGKGMQLGCYNSNTEAKIVLEILAEKLVAGVECIKMPNDKEIKAKVNLIGLDKTNYTGKKQKGHGGS